MKQWKILWLLWSVGIFSACADGVGELGFYQHARIERAEEQIQLIQAKFDLREDWNVDVSSEAENQVIRRLFLVEGTLYASQTEAFDEAYQEAEGLTGSALDSAYWLYAVDAGSGAIRWLHRFDWEIRYPPAYEFFDGTETLYLTVGSELIAVDLVGSARKGLEKPPVKRTFNVNRSLSTGPCIVRDSVYVGASDGRIYTVPKALDPSNNVALPSSSAAGAIATTPVQPAQSSSLLVASEDGNLYFQLIGSRSLSKPILPVGPVVSELYVDRDKRTVYVASADAHLYAIDSIVNLPLWSYDLGIGLVAPPYEYRPDRFLLVNEANELILFDAARAREKKKAVLWTTRNVKQVLALSRNRDGAYVATADGKIAWVQATDGKMTDAVDASDLDIHLTNTGAHGRLYFTCAAGKIWSLVEKSND